MFEIVRENSLTFKLSNGSEFPALDVFINIMSKVEKEASKKGFRNMYDNDEKIFIRNFVREIKNEANYRNE
jgi:hypothetical protein